MARYGEKVGRVGRVENRHLTSYSYSMKDKNLSEWHKEDCTKTFGEE
jgi:hypothetical protein